MLLWMWLWMLLYILLGMMNVTLFYMWMLMLLQMFVDVLATEGLQNLIKATRSK